jgi:hypothetical protein
MLTRAVRGGVRSAVAHAHTAAAAGRSSVVAAARTSVLLAHLRTHQLQRARTTTQPLLYAASCSAGARRAFSVAAGQPEQRVQADEQVRRAHTGRRRILS